MKFSCSLVILLIACGLVFVAGCTQGAGPAPGSVPAPVATPDLPALALAPADLPSCYAVTERSLKSPADVGSLARQLGWQAGYTVRYTCPTDGSEPTVLIHSLAIYPAENIPAIAAMVDAQDRSGAECTWENLTFPAYGPSMRGFYGTPVDAAETPVAPGNYVISSGNETAPRTTEPAGDIAEIIFHRGMVFEVMRMSGPGTNLTLIEDLAARAYGEIPETATPSHAFLPGTSNGL